MPSSVDGLGSRGGADGSVAARLDVIGCWWFLAQPVGAYRTGVVMM